MDIKHLEYFVSAAIALNFTRAAEKHHMAQTAMSRIISNLEQEVEATLFRRTNHSVSLTPEGELFFEDAQKIIKMYHRSLEKIQASLSNIEGSVAIGIGPHERPLLGHLISNYHSLYPNVDIKISQFGYAELSHELQRGNIDVAIASFRLPKSIQGCQYKALISVPNVYLLAKDHPLLQKGSFISPQELTSYKSAVHAEPDGPYSPEMVRSETENYLFTPKDFVAVNSLQAKLACVETLNMYCAVPPFVAEEYKDRFSIITFDETVYPQKRIMYCATIMDDLSNKAAISFYNSIEPLAE